MIWGSDNDTNMQKIWKNRTGMVPLGSAEDINYDKIQVPDVLFSGMTCPDWTSLGSEKADKGITGHLYADQIKWILTRETRGLKATVLEQTDNALRQFKSTVIQITGKLKSPFYVTYAVIPVWRFGDVCNRKRLYILAISKSAG